jgi:hypothetical protein
VPVKTLTLARAGKAMILVCRFGPTGEVTVNLDPKMFDTSGDWIAVNAETGERIARLEPGSFTMTIPRHDFRLVRIESPVAGE